MNKETLGQRLKSLREEKCLTQMEMANQLQIDKSTIAKYETDKVEPSLFMFKTLVLFFGTTADYLLGLED